MIERFRKPRRSHRLLTLSVAGAAGSGLIVGAFLWRGQSPPAPGELEQRAALSATNESPTVAFALLYAEGGHLDVAAAVAEARGELDASAVLRELKTWLRTRLELGSDAYVAYRDRNAERFSDDVVRDATLHLLLDYAEMREQEAAAATLTEAVERLYSMNTVDSSYGAGMPELVYLLDDLQPRFLEAETPYPQLDVMLSDDDIERYVGMALGMPALWGARRPAIDDAGRMRLALVPVRVRTSNGLETSMLFMLIRSAAGQWVPHQIVLGLVVVNRGPEANFVWVY